MTLKEILLSRIKGEKSNIDNSFNFKGYQGSIYCSDFEFNHIMYSWQGRHKGGLDFTTRPTMISDIELETKTNYVLEAELKKNIELDYTTIMKNENNNHHNINSTNT